MIDGATHIIKDSERSLVQVLVEPADAGFVLVVKATVSGEGLFVASCRRLSRREAERGRQIARLLRRSE